MTGKYHTATIYFQDDFKPTWDRFQQLIKLVKEFRSPNNESERGITSKGIRAVITKWVREKEAEILLSSEKKEKNANIKEVSKEDEEDG